jgi:hypothetical protein
MIPDLAPTAWRKLVPLGSPIRIESPNEHTPEWGSAHDDVEMEGAGPQEGKNGGREGIRTLGLSVANAALSQLSYAPMAELTRIYHDHSHTDNWRHRTPHEDATRGTAAAPAAALCLTWP